MSNTTYIVLCGRGLTKDVCPLINQFGHCVECNFVRYVIREPLPRAEENEQEPSVEQEEYHV